MATLATNLQPHHFSRRNMDSSMESSMDSNDGDVDAASSYGRESVNIDNNSCCSDDTVLSVGNETPVVVQTESLSFKNIESHLNAISKITNSTLDPELKSPVSPLNNHRLTNSPLSVKSATTDSLGFYGEKSNPASPASNNLFSPISPGRLLYTSGSESPESANRSPKPQDTGHNFFYAPKANNNEPALSGSLKFSIDNILKADFGRRITEPINIRKSKPKKAAEKGEDGKPGPVDLSKAEEKSGKSEGSGQPMLWPAWVYCTRYSDRPSSGNCHKLC